MFKAGSVYNVNAEGAILTRAGRREAARLAAGHAFQEWAEQRASEPLREDLREALQDSHDRAIGRAKAQLQYNQDAIDRVYAAAAQAAQPRQHFVRRGAVYKRCDATRLRPGEQYFAKCAGGWEYVGVINAYGEQPDQEMTL
jgi:hypothetical protein